MGTTKSNVNGGKSIQPKGNIIVEKHGAILVACIDGGPHALLDQEIAKQLKELVDKVDKDPNVRAVIFTGTHPERFLSHSDVTWLQEGGVGFPPITTGFAAPHYQYPELSTSYINSFIKTTLN